MKKEECRMQNGAPRAPNASPFCTLHSNSAFELVGCHGTAPCSAV